MNISSLKNVCDGPCTKSGGIDANAAIGIGSILAR